MMVLSSIISIGCHHFASLALVHSLQIAVLKKIASDMDGFATHACATYNFSNTEKKEDGKSRVASSRSGTTCCTAVVTSLTDKSQSQPTFRQSDALISSHNVAPFSKHLLRAASLFLFQTKRQNLPPAHFRPKCSTSAPRSWHTARSLPVFSIDLEIPRTLRKGHKPRLQAETINLCVCTWTNPQLIQK